MATFTRSMTRFVVPGEQELRLERRIVESKARLKGLDAVKESADYDELFKEIASLQSELERLRLESRDVHERQEL
jgi:hypothetical protein